VCRTAVRKANREAVDVLGGKSMILVCIFTPLKSLVSLAVHRVAQESCKETPSSPGTPGTETVGTPGALPGFRLRKAYGATSCEADRSKLGRARPAASRQ
jgi:hypothetical protein